MRKDGPCVNATCANADTTVEHFQFSFSGVPSSRKSSRPSSDGVTTSAGQSHPRNACDSTTACDSTSACDPKENGIYVHVSKSTSHKREWDKENSCAFCGKLSTNCMKHVMTNHKSEFEVQLIDSKPKRSKERALLLEKLRLKGNYKHNCNVIRNGSGMIIPVRSPSDLLEAPK